MGTPHDVYEAISNGTTSTFTNFHLQIAESMDALSNGVVFTSFDGADQEFGPDFTPSFALDSPSKEQPSSFRHTGPRDLNFTGELRAGGTAVDLYFSLSMPDLGAGNTYTFTLTQTPTVGIIPERETHAFVLAGLGLIGFIARCRKRLLLYLKPAASIRPRALSHFHGRFGYV